jgi:hypothetical protein
MAEPGKPSEELVSRAEKLLATHADFQQYEPRAVHHRSRD